MNREYTLNGWDICASEERNDWELSPSATEEEWNNFTDNESIRFRRLSDAKKWTKTEEAKELRNKYVK